MLDFEELAISEKVGLAAFIVSLQPSKQTVRADQFADSAYTPTPVLAIQLINQLVDKHYISVHGDSSEKTAKLSISELNSNTWLRLNIRNERKSFTELLSLIRISGEDFGQFSEKEALIASVLVDECRAFVAQTAGSNSIKIGHINDEPACLADLLSLRSLPETFLLLWRSVKDVCPIETNFYQLRDGYSITFERLAQKAFSFHLEYERNGQRIKPFKRPPGNRRSSIMLVLTETIMSLNISYDEFPKPLLKGRVFKAMDDGLSDEEKQYLDDGMPIWLEAYTTL